jgi:catechol 2,3-dioxygenase-like lactoylglutathione lyase family enzyme
VKVELVIPILNVSNVSESVEWFKKLGWELGFAWRSGMDGSVDFGGVKFGDHEIFLCRDGQGGRGRGANTTTGGPGADQQSDKGAWIAIWIDDVDAMYQHCLRQGLEITLPPTDEPWQVREMHVRHPDGHVFRFSRVVED